MSGRTCKIDINKCIGCGKREKLCPMKNITIKEHKAVSGDRCTCAIAVSINAPGRRLLFLGKGL